MATRSQPHGTRWLKFGSIEMIKAVCTVATVTKEIMLSALCQIVQIVAVWGKSSCRGGSKETLKLKLYLFDLLSGVLWICCTATAIHNNPQQIETSGAWA